MGRNAHFEGWRRGKGGYIKYLRKISAPALYCLRGPACLLTHGFYPGKVSELHLSRARHASSAPLAKFFATHSFIGFFHSQSIYQRFRNRFCNAIVNSTTVSHLFTCQSANGGGGGGCCCFSAATAHPHLFLFEILSQGEEIGSTKLGHGAGMSSPAASGFCIFPAGVSHCR